MMNPTAAAAPQPEARATGVVYLLYFLTAIAGEVLIKGLVVPGDAATTAHNLLAHQALFRLGCAVGLVSTALYVVMAALFYQLFKPVNGTLSLLAAFFNLTGDAIQAAGSLFRLAPLVVLGGGRSFSGFKEEQLQAVALLFLKLHVQSSSVEPVFFACYDLLLGWLIFRSAFLPRALGVAMAVAGLGWLSVLYPPLATALSPGIQALGFLAEFALLLWLLSKGVNIPRWQEQAGAAGR